MDRILSFRQKLVAFGLTAALGLPVSLSLGGVSFAPEPSDPPLKPGEKYNESAWGQAPARVEAGYDSGFGHHVIEGSDEALDQAERDSGSTGRNPSRSLASSKESSGTTKRDMPTDGVKAEALLESSPSALARKGVQEVALIAGDLGFFPKTVFLTRDVPVRVFVTGASKNTLCFMMDSFAVRRQVHTQKIEEINFTPHTAGKFRFYCPVNGMEGSMVVRELVSGVRGENRGR